MFVSDYLLFGYLENYGNFVGAMESFGDPATAERPRRLFVEECSVDQRWPSNLVSPQPLSCRFLISSV